MKVGYLSLDGYQETVYLDEDEIREGPMFGTHKHTDASVWVQWNEDRRVWMEVPAP